MQPVPNDFIMTVRLQAQEWNQVLALLSDAHAPYRMTAPIITKMQDQLSMQVQDQDTGDVSRQD